ncbi:Maph69 [Matsumuraeses phaseoli granulovirus]|uniref:Maph69 n=1 Tax=Matsumuraeses phaseoli granulovirus TaxID=2760664 RepID=A0AAE7SYR0_9BBAC|nr:Maph69 [Matsumuraeses phaseoli granulovirus]QOD40032.1 Maph69 [Matsumuraeses phaseoli granulovirus]
MNLINVLLIFTAIFVFVFLLIHITKNNKYKNANDCASPVASSCQQYKDCFGIVRTCNVIDRFDIQTNQCQNYYLTDCGDRPNPELPEEHNLCNYYYSGQTNQSVFPSVYCQHYINCNLSPQIGTCFSEEAPLFSIPHNQCKARHEVDCGSRIIPETNNLQE